jgi:NADPH:quinone reductase-like Zn-dependent oxidoreductase
MWDPVFPAFRQGDAVHCMVGGVDGVQGTLAEYVAVNAALLETKARRYRCAMRRRFLW